MEAKFNLENYENFLGEVKKTDGGRWEKLQKRTAKLFQVLMAGDLRELVFVLKHYPDYVEIVCGHFRYLYNYTETVADMYSASKLLYISQKYHKKQFVQNIVGKLQKIDKYDIASLKAFLQELLKNQKKIHPIILGYYKIQIQNVVENKGVQKLQKIIFQKHIQRLPTSQNYDFSAKVIAIS